MENNISVKLNNTASAPLKAELLKYNNITSVSGVSHTPAAGITHGSGFKKSIEDKEWLNANYFTVDEDYLENMEVKLVAGRYFKAEDGDGNKNFIVINEKALTTFNFKTVSEALGQTLLMQRDSSTRQIIGVVKDYNHSMLMEELEPMTLVYDQSQIGALQVRYTGPYDNAVATIEKAWTAVNPALKVDHKLIESEIKYMYTTVFGDIVNVLGVISFLAILISCLGLLGMATYTIETRMKEISIRKVLGSTDKGLILLLSKGFLSMLAIAVSIGVPASWFINNLWLEFMAYHISISVGMMTLGILILVLLGAFTVGSQTLRAAFTNPVDNLKNE
jgi:putative ABC transport system permease protein